MTAPLSPARLLLDLDSLRDHAMDAQTLNALAFVMANELYPLLPFHQALVFEHRGDAWRMLCVSGLATPVEDSPYLVWLGAAVPWLATQANGWQPVWIARDAVVATPRVDEGWREWWPAGAFVVPMHARDGSRMGMLVFLLDAPPALPLTDVLRGVWRTFAYCWEALAGRHRRRRRISRRQWVIAAGLLALLMLVPVRQTALAPAEIISREADVISAPIDGVIARMLVRPNQPVAAGTPLFALDETTLRSRATVLSREVDVADAELAAATQQAFDSPQSKSQLTLLQGRAQQRRAELGEVTAQLKRTVARAPRAGVAVYADPNDWLGRPVTTGERVLQVADPRIPGVVVQLPVADAISLEPGARITLYLSAYPLAPLHGHIVETSYEARPTDDSVVAYRLLASIDDAPLPAHARLGLHGTAKLYGQRVVLGYYLLRRPISALRAWTGW
ncbi:efflux RND transporter periplasmic adaptor subunit [Luteibacter aegosomatissinici]|uniref:efflux RND transporter periplasmic adaptor subunit n=1 Tax=Luteibacter aegosomatissinici TaxID=2911539 RepID=UPI001FF7754E|nr:HlyD family efflux transporter periplasmic adaptor subunit [Luteibacter aegosomatissinici]UPG95557.1 HlyD family efflux transporter periplasmic adaptor subunit [Luteibacter aegosomatissinici]